MGTKMKALRHVLSLSSKETSEQRELIENQQRAIQALSEKIQNYDLENEEMGTKIDELRDDTSKEIIKSVEVVQIQE